MTTSLHLSSRNQVLKIFPSLFLLGRNSEDWPTIDEAGYASLIRRKNSHSNIDQNESDEPLYEKIPENAGSR